MTPLGTMVIRGLDSVLRMTAGTVRIVTDSACDLPDDLIDEYGIAVVPLSIRFGAEELIDREQLIKGGESGEPAVVVGKPSQSPLMDAIQWNGLEMPPKENDRLTTTQIKYIEK